MARINISVPEELQKRLQSLDINVSGVCQEALEKELLAKKKIELGGNKMQKLKQKILAQKNESAYQDWQWGRELAKEYAEKDFLDYEDIIEVRNDRLTEGAREFLDVALEERNDGRISSEESAKKGFIAGLQDIADELKINTN